MSLTIVEQHAPKGLPIVEFDAYNLPSNGIRFSISDMSPLSSRIMPTIYQDRSAISLYDAQFLSGTKAQIPAAVIEDVLTALLRFRSTCQDFGVIEGNTRVVATEATRNAINRDDLLNRIAQKTGWEVQLLAKEEEGRLGAMGIASSIDELSGICMDMGGGSVQLTWVVKRHMGDVEMGPSISLPYGAAALMAELNGREQVALEEEISMNLQKAITTDLAIPRWLSDEARRNNGFNVYLSGGGFRGWGHFLISHDQAQPYPIPIVNGYSVSNTELFSNVSTLLESSKAHRISIRRASQVPAVQLLLRALDQAQLKVSRATFAQGGVREGLLYDSLPPSIQAQSSLIAATLPYAPPSAAALVDLLMPSTSDTLNSPLIVAIINLLYLHGSISKDIRAAAALRCTTTGVLASTHGLTHYERGMLALILCERWDAALSEADTEYFRTMAKICGPTRSWWAAFIGRMAKGIASLYPAGLVREGEKKVSVESTYPTDKQIAFNDGPESSDFRSCQITITVLSQDIEIAGLVNDWARDISKLGKKKNWKDGMEGLDVSVEVKQAKDN